MTEFAIEIENLTKKFKDRVVIDRLNLKIKKGETIGVIGSNGSGKSTLIRILSGIIKPSEGKVLVEGSVTSILEVGNGFHPDLTGRENCYLSARLRGYSDKEISCRIDKIIDFSELGEAIDYPIKHYSNGMYLRLAFSIFEQFNSDILLLDEVLSVGDAAFREKIAKVIRKFKAEGRTIIMVSHNMNEVINFCERVLYLSPGNVIDSNEIREVVDDYLLKSRMIGEKNESSLSFEEYTDKNSNSTIWTSDLLEMVSIQFADNEISKFSFDYSSGFEIQILFSIFRKSDGVHLIIKIFNLSGNLVLTTSTAFLREPEQRIHSIGDYLMKISIPGSYLNKGIYTISVIISEGDKLNAYWENVATFKITHDRWMKSRPWATIHSSILTQLPTYVKKLK